MVLDCVAPAMDVDLKHGPMSTESRKGKCPELPTEILHGVLSHLHLDDLNACRLVSAKFNDVAMERLRAFAVLNRRGMQRRWEPCSAMSQHPRLFRPGPRPRGPYWLDTAHPAQDKTPAVQEVSIGLHHPDECASFQFNQSLMFDPRASPAFALPRHVPVLKITLQGGPLIENFWRREDDPACTPFGGPQPIYGYKMASPHGERTGVPRREPYTDGVEAVRPDDLTVQFRSCGFSDMVGKSVETIDKLVLYNVPFNYGEVADGVCHPFFDKVEEMVWIITYPGRCKIGEHCNDVGHCADHANSIVDYKVTDLLRLIPPAGTSRLKKVTLVFKQKYPGMRWDNGCKHRGKRGAWWAEELLGNLARELAKPMYGHLALEFVNLECLSRSGDRSVSGFSKSPNPGRKFMPSFMDEAGLTSGQSVHGELDAVMKKAHFDALVANPNLPLKDIQFLSDQLSFSTMQDFIGSGDSYGVFTEKETLRWIQFLKLGPEAFSFFYPSPHDFFTDEHRYYKVKGGRKRKAGHDSDPESGSESSSDSVLA